MSAKDDLKEGLLEIVEKMATMEDKEEANAYYTEQLATLIDNHAKALIATLTVEKVVSLGLIAGVYPVVAVAPGTSSLLTIDDNPIF